MWCSTCQQDVPSLGSPGNGADLRCGKCGENLSKANRENVHASAGTPTIVPAIAAAADSAALQRLLHDGPLDDDDWALEAELRGIQRQMGVLKSRSTVAAEPVAVHVPHEAPAAWHAAPSPVAGASPHTAQQPRGHAVAWTVLSVGLAVFACGAVLLGWSLVAQREDLWPVGMPLALIGQAGLILGLILQLDGLWHTSRKTAAALSELDGELKNVRQATTLLSTSHSSGAQSFYLHLAEGASPQLLLADLKGQMDLLAQQMARGKG
jgi:hypothetical protein